MAALNELYLRIAQSKFHYLKFILEAYDNLAILSSFDQRRGVVIVRYSEDVSRELFGLLTALAGKLR